jgi:hypothetical protein
MPLMAGALTRIDAARGPDATSQLSVLQRVGASLGTALFVVVLERSHSFGTSYATVVALTALSVLPCFLLAATDKRRGAVDPVLLTEPAV